VVSGLTVGSGSSSTNLQQRAQPIVQKNQNPEESKAGGSSSSVDLSNLSPAERAEIEETKRKLNVHNKTEGNKRLNEVKGERKDLRVKLDQF